MTDKDWGAFCDCMKAASEITATPPKSTTGLSLMFKVLERYELKDIQKAVLNHFSSDDGKFFPLPAHIIRQIEGSEAERAHKAWRVFLMALSEHGYYDSVRFPSAGYHYAIRMLGGWLKISSEYNDLTDKEIEFRRGAFVALFMRGEKEFSLTGEPNKLPEKSYLPGYFEITNAETGYMDALPDVVDIESGRKIKRAEVFALAPKHEGINAGNVIDINKLRLNAGKERMA